MNTQLAPVSSAALEVGAAMAKAADAIRDRALEAYGKKKITREEYQDAIVQEMELRTKAGLIVVEDLGHVISHVQQQQVAIEQAIKDAKAKIESVQGMKRALNIVAALIVLAGAIYAQDYEAAVKAAKALAGMVKQKPAKADGADEPAKKQAMSKLAAKRASRPRIEHSPG